MIKQLSIIFMLILLSLSASAVYETKQYKALITDNFNINNHNLIIQKVQYLKTNGKGYVIINDSENYDKILVTLKFDNETLLDINDMQGTNLTRGINFKSLSFDGKILSFEIKYDKSESFDTTPYLLVLFAIMIITFISVLIYHKLEKK